MLARVIFPKVLLFKLLLLLTSIPIITTQASAPITDSEAEDLATEVYVYGYPLVTMDKTREVMTNIVKANDFHAPMGQFANLATYPEPNFKDVTTPNADTLYSAAWIDLRREPYVLHVPNEKDRYYLMPMLSGWTDVFSSIGTRTTGTEANDYVITGPNWKGKLPAGLKEIKSPTNLVWIIGRTYSSGTPEDYAEVHQIQKQYKLTPLSFFGKSYTPPNGTINPNIDMKTPVRDQVNNLSGKEFFSKLALLLRFNPPAEADAPMVAKMAKLGIVPGKDFDMDRLDPVIVRNIERAPQFGQKKIIAHQEDAGKDVNGWLITTKTGNYGTDYLQRAFIAYFGLGANIPQDAIYPMTHVDGTGKPLTGKEKYILHFDNRETPPAKAFWSLTMYNKDYFFAENSLNRYTISPRNDLRYNPDGSLDIYIQHTSPGKDKESNWLPAPEGLFNLTLRVYWPEESMINGSWTPPAVHRAI